MSPNLFRLLYQQRPCSKNEIELRSVNLWQVYQRACVQSSYSGYMGGHKVISVVRVLSVDFLDYPNQWGTFLLEEYWTILFKIQVLE